MKKLKQLSFIALALTIIISSCTIEKRVHMSGYHIEWKNGTHNSNKQSLVDNDNKREIKQDKTAKVEQNKIEIDTVDYSIITTDENTIASADNSIFVHPISKISTQKNKSKISMNENVLNSKIIVKSSNKQNKNVKNHSSTYGGGKSQLIALLLCIFIGVLGIHRFYLGYTGVGILMLLTAGVCGILALIDLIRIITGDLKPKNGDYSDKL